MGIRQMYGSTIIRCIRGRTVIAMEYMEDTSKHEILEAIGLLADQVEDIRTDVSSLKSDMTVVKATMVTKSYLDDKLGDFKGDMVRFVRTEDAKILAKLR